MVTNRRASAISCAVPLFNFHRRMQASTNSSRPIEREVGSNPRFDANLNRALYPCVPQAVFNDLALSRDRHRVYQFSVLCCPAHPLPIMCQPKHPSSQMPKRLQTLTSPTLSCLAYGHSTVASTSSPCPDPFSPLAPPLCLPSLSPSCSIFTIF